MNERNPLLQAIPAHMARLNITWNGSNGDLPDLVPYDAGDADLKRIAAEGIGAGYIPGIDAARRIDLGDFVVDRFPATGEVGVNRIFIRPKTPFG